mmetsp:Transcript_40254/g.85862  ORF Transcript_40254/g.85862 Transcript_40254/m.85862 type:complete len:119 (+) Transcript_40254:70-426(+)|eukprot:CAMPEP_0180475246 /NCGR_PEP_ID=MMETSP1036_2-20121128/31099_1 /TAXON_ID=632150 /ORGANISM="Azadinium spinosum, Strain 3D9" /LENGTH=118 /DNA_ID=CAMNT_0022482599 /DNA_START=54 /DNA_END=410 /DNA_ORIENTATION=-
MMLHLKAVALALALLPVGAVRTALVSGKKCADYRKIVDGECADICLKDYVSFCPRSLIVSKGGLAAGTCAEVKYTVPHGVMSQTAGPCGELKFNKYIEAPLEASDEPSVELNSTSTVS